MEHTTDDRVLYFRCAQTGKRFSVTFRRYSPAHKFQIVNVMAEEQPVQANAEQVPPPSKPFQSTAVQQAVRNIQTRGLSAVGSLLKSAGQQLAQQLSRQLQASTARFGGREFAMSDFDLAGWYCPHCGHSAHSQRGNVFVQCGKCHEYVCGGRTRTVGNTRIFACHDGCGGSGEIRDTLSSYRGRDFASGPDAKALQSSESRQIPTPPKRSLPPK